MPLHVQREVVGPGEGTLTQVTLERPVSGVLPEVTRELVGTSELPAAALPAAVVRFLSCVRPEVRLQVGALGVRLPTAGESAGVRRGPFPRPRPATPLRLGVHHVQRGGRRSEQDPLTGQRLLLLGHLLLLLEAHGCVLREHAGEPVVVLVVRRYRERQLHPRGVRVREPPGGAAVVVVVRVVRVEALREGERGGGDHVCLVALGGHEVEVVRAERRRHAARGGLRRGGEPRLLLVGHHARPAALLLHLGAALRSQTQDGSVRVHGDGLHFNVRMLGE